MIDYNRVRMVSSKMDTTMKKYCPVCSRLILAVLASALAGVCGCTMSDSCHECSINDVKISEGKCISCQYNDEGCLSWHEQKTMDACGSQMEDSECVYGKKECDDKKNLYKFCDYSIKENRFIWMYDEDAYKNECLQCKKEHECDEKDVECDTANRSYRTCVLNEKTGCRVWKDDKKSFDSKCKTEVGPNPPDPKCEDKCSEGEKECKKDSYIICEKDEETGCLAPHEKTENFEKECSVPCDNKCSPFTDAGDCREADKIYRYCKADKDGCLDWVDDADMYEEKCSGDAPVPDKCSGPKACKQEGEGQCDDPNKTYLKCEKNEETECLEWKDYKTKYKTECNPSSCDANEVSCVLKPNTYSVCEYNEATKDYAWVDKPEEYQSQCLNCSMACKPGDLQYDNSQNECKYCFDLGNNCSIWKVSTGRIPESSAQVVLKPTSLFDIAIEPKTDRLFIAILDSLSNSLRFTILGHAKGGCPATSWYVDFDGDASKIVGPQCAISESGNIRTLWEHPSKSDAAIQAVSVTEQTMTDIFGTAEGMINSHDIYNPSIHLKNPRVVYSKTGNPYFVFEQSPTDTSYHFSSSSIFVDDDKQMLVDGSAAPALEKFQVSPDIAAEASGNAIVVWEEYSKDAPVHQIKYAFYNVGASLSLAGSVMEVKNSGSWRFNPRIALDGGNNMIIVYENAANESDPREIHAYTYAKSGNNYSVTSQELSLGKGKSPEVCYQKDGAAVVVWFDPDVNGGDVMAVKLAGTTSEPPKSVASNTNGVQKNPVVVCPENGSAIVGWMDDNDGDGNFMLMLKSLE